MPGVTGAAGWPAAPMRSLPRSRRRRLGPAHGRSAANLRRGQTSPCSMACRRPQAASDGLHLNPGELLITVARPPPIELHVDASEERLRDGQEMLIINRGGQVRRS